MNVAVLHTPHWTISTRRRGEVLTATASVGSIELAVLSVPDGFSSSEIEGWLRDLISVAHETARGDSQPRPIPALLHHALTGLLFSHAELWEPAGVTYPCSAAFAAGEDEVGFGWVGEAAIQVWLNDLPLDAGWVRVRDDSGREACAISLDAHSRVRIRLEWSPRTQGELSAVVEAQWPFSDAIESAAEVGPTAEPIRVVAAVMPPEARAEAALESALLNAPGAPQASMLEPAAHDLPFPAIEPPAYLPAESSSAESNPPASEPSATDTESSTPSAPARGGRRAGRLATAMSRISSWWTRKPRSTEDDVPADWVDEQTPRLLSSVPSSGVESWDPHLRVLGAPKAPPASGPPVLRLPAGGASSAAESTALPPAISPAAVSPAASGLPFFAADQDSPPLPGLAPTWIIAPESEPPTDATELPPMEAAPSVVSAEAPFANRPADPLQGLAESRPGGIEEWISRELATQAAARAPASPPPAIAEPMVVAPPTSPVVEIAPEFEAPAPSPEAPPAQASGAPTARTPLRPRWPSAAEIEAPTPLWKRPWAWAAVMLALFVGGWLVGGRAADRDGAGGPQGIGRALRTLGLGGAHFDVMTNSRPEGAWIAVDGKDLARRTPASLDLPAGRHVVTLSFSDLGGVSYTVTGERSQQLAIDASMWGSLIVRESDSGLPVTVELDGREVGFAPVVLDSVLPGAHELRFSGPGMVPWGQTVEVRVRQQAEVLAHPMTSPANGVLEVRATLVDEQGVQPLSGGEVWIDGVLKGRTPLTLDLPRGPHSARVVYHGESAPVQVIDLPGGNQRFANFELGGGADRPGLSAIGMPERMAIDQPAVASAALNGVAFTDVKEMWLHVRTPEGPWRRYQMDILKSTFGAVGVAVYPSTLFDDQGQSRYYTSALTGSGDEYFTEIATVRLLAPARAGANR